MIDCAYVLKKNLISIISDLSNKLLNNGFYIIHFESRNVQMEMRTTIILFAVIGVSISTQIKSHSPDSVIDDGKMLSEEVSLNKPFYPEQAKDQGEIIVSARSGLCDFIEAEMDKATNELFVNVENLDVSDMTVCKAITENLIEIANLTANAINTNCNNNHNFGNFVVKRFRRQSCLEKLWNEYPIELVNPFSWTYTEDEKHTSENVNSCVRKLIAKHQPGIESDFEERPMVSVACSPAKDLYEQCLRPMELNLCKYQVSRSLARLVLFLISVFYLLKSAYIYCRMKLESAYIYCRMKLESAYEYFRKMFFKIRKIAFVAIIFYFFFLITPL